MFPVKEKDVLYQEEGEGEAEKNSTQLLSVTQED